MPEKHYAGYRYCKRCEFPKPPGFHHCSSCGTCVAGMDHHCPFINSCVATRTLRPFLLFVFWATLGTAWAALVCLSAVGSDVPGAIDSFSRHSLGQTFRSQYGRSSMWMHLGPSRERMGHYQRLLRFVLILPTHFRAVFGAWGLSAMMAGGFGLILAGMLGGLFLSTLRLAALGTSYIDSLQVRRAL